MHIDGRWFKDDAGRTLILRGVNLGGSTKVPKTPNGATCLRENLLDSRKVSFVGRPFPLEEADEHFRRLKTWGLTFLRFLITWEAIEHEGPGVYDNEYLDYIEKITARAAEHGISFFVDPHQDVWSRWTGGDGAPGWTMELLGMELLNMEKSGAGLVHGLHGGRYPQMQWSTNNYRYGAATMFTLFFGGNHFTPKTVINDVPVQEFLQSHYINAVKQVAARLGKYANVNGFDTLNEPITGMIGTPDITTTRHIDLKFGIVPSYFQTMLLASGYPQRVPEYFPGLKKSRVIRKIELNPGRVRLYKAGYECVFRQNGVWTDIDGKPEVLKRDHFLNVNGKKVDFERDYLKPFVKRYLTELRKVDPKFMIFVEGAPMRPIFGWEKEDEDNVVFAGHWYDGITLITKKYRPYLALNLFTGKIEFGREKARESYVTQLAALASHARERMGDIPVLVGEFGLPFDMYNRKSYKTGNFKKQIKAFDAYFNAMDKNLLNATIWNYTSDNTNERGDQWNDEDLSVYSEDQRDNADDINSGGRALPGFIRPCAKAIAGIPSSMEFELKKRIFNLEFTHDNSCAEPTEIFVPLIQYPAGFKIIPSDGRWEKTEDEQIIRYYHTLEREKHQIRIEPL
ncbi:MAG: cellulase family glycosylhydrolase [Spirochaetales bacterium]|nr:cellulase family glycosylhydrolase [Spirochaetales bacterium]